MTPRRHAAAARALVTTCGGVDEAAAACRLKKSSLSNAQNVNFAYLLPVDVIAELEGYCGRAVYSQMMVDAAAAGNTVGDVDLVGEAIAMMEKTVEINASLHQYLADGKLSPNEQDCLLRNSNKLRADLARFDGVLGEEVKS